jgi:hypothetical protein
MTIQKSISRFGLLATLALIGASAHAQITTYDFTGATGSQVSTAASGVAAGLSSSLLTRGSGVTASAGANSIAATGWSLGAIDLNDYFELTLTPDAGQELALTSIDFSERRSGTGIRDIAVRTSLDSFGANVATFNVPDDTLVRRQTVGFGVSFANLTAPVTVRIYGFNAEAATGSWRLGVSGGTDNPGAFPANLVVNGAITPLAAVPEPGTVALIGLTLLPGIALLRRRK